jgi:hypothetical protein
MQTPKEIYEFVCSVEGRCYDLSKNVLSLSMDVLLRDSFIYVDEFCSKHPSSALRMMTQTKHGNVLDLLDCARLWRACRNLSVQQSNQTYFIEACCIQSPLLCALSKLSLYLIVNDSSSQVNIAVQAGLQFMFNMVTNNTNNQDAIFSLLCSDIGGKAIYLIFFHQNGCSRIRCCNVELFIFSCSVMSHTLNMHIVLVDTCALTSALPRTTWCLL